MYRILVTGSRDWADAGVIEDALCAATVGPAPDSAPIPASHVTVVHGGARGADTMAHMIARRLGFNVEVYPAEWRRYGIGAGHKRNAQMVALGANVCLAFILDRSTGATGCADRAEAAGIETYRYERTTT